ncbi:MAG: cytochrome c biogenesis protein CcsA [Deltaproteobacteria bacterium]|nr:cytochrome c biogenesis protein CcsA [Deltaproteobacteria bacterium]
MATATSVLSVLALLTYFVTAVLFLVQLFRRDGEEGVWPLKLFAVGLVLHTGSRITQAIHLGAMPGLSTGQAMNILALCTGGLFLLLVRRYRVHALGAFTTPLAAVALAGSLAFEGGDGAVPAALRSAWFPIHLTAAIMGDALFVLAGIAGGAFLVQENRLRKKKLGPLFHKLPPLHVLDEIMQRLIVGGFLFMTFGMAAGSYLAKHHWGSYWHWDPRQIISLMTWLFYAGILHARLTIGWQGRRAAWVTCLASVLVLTSLFGIELFTKTLHTGAYTR